MDDIELYFKILGLTIEATQQEAMEAYRDLVKIWHPDRFANDPKLAAKAQEKLKEINEAYRIIKDFFENPSKYQHATKSGQMEPDPDISSQGSSEQSTFMKDNGNSNSKEFIFEQKLKAKGPLCWIFMVLGGSFGQIWAKKMKFVNPVEAFWISVWLVAALGALGYFAGFFLLKKINEFPKSKQEKTKLAWGAGIGGVILFFIISISINAYIPKFDIKKFQPKQALDVVDPFDKSNIPLDFIDPYKSPETGSEGGKGFQINNWSEQDWKSYFASLSEKDRNMWRWWLQASEYFDQKSYYEAVALYKQLIRLYPGHASLWFSYLGLSYANLGMYNETIEAYREAIRLDPNNADIYFRLGLSYYELGMYVQAVEAYKKALNLKPDDSNLHAHLCISYLKLNDRVSAIGEYNVLNSLDPEKAKRLLNLYSKEFNR
jgi:tetratricopeptide (TPR) repeat protein